MFEIECVMKDLSALSQLMRHTKYAVAVIALVSTVRYLGSKIGAPISNLTGTSMRCQTLTVFAKLEHFRRLLTFAERTMVGFAHIWSWNIAAQEGRDAISIDNLFGVVHMMGLHVHHMMNAVDFV